ncbi:nuclear transport factor 2 family protein [Jejuia spongiicola]|uniref:Nuclear transport factor 2 family protein n=1 Tax=Jejuia spongiicola TaxID=2942207 RepID=A0ABT0QI46_9FLAO|nr:nuclear transport factor 2 family protein [Jejuia spongiicola]MCL6296283.1 nuclear transport factor 2 family protein [Jejuia spongiicola]
MKNKLFGIVILAVLVIYSCKEQQNETNKSVGTTEVNADEIQSPTKEEVEIAVLSFNDAIVNPTVASMEALCADNLTYGHSSGKIQDKAEFIDDIVNGPFNFSSVEAPEQSIYISGNTAVVRNIFLAKATKDGKSIDIRLGCVQVFQKQKDDGLKLLTRQAYKLPN